MVGAVPWTAPTELRVASLLHHLTSFCVLVQPGDMNAMFAGIEERFGKRYEVPIPPYYVFYRSCDRLLTLCAPPTADQRAVARPMGGHL